MNQLSQTKPTNSCPCKSFILHGLRAYLKQMPHRSIFSKIAYPTIYFVEHKKLRGVLFIF